MKQKILEKCKRALMLLMALMVLAGTVPMPKAYAAKWILVYFEPPAGYSYSGGSTYVWLRVEDGKNYVTLGQESSFETPQISLPANKEISGWSSSPNIGTVSRGGLASKRIYTDKLNGSQVTFTPVISDKKYKVSFVRDGYTFSSKKVAYGKTVSRPSEPKRKNYIFIDWYQDANLTKKFDFNTKITKNTKVYAKYIDADIKFTGEKKTKEVEEEKTFTLTPESYQNGTNDTSGWSWDKEFFEADFSSKPTFKAIKAGETKITYKNARGQKATITVTVKAKPAAAVVNPEPEPAPTVETDPSGNGDSMEKWIMYIWMGAAAIVMLLAAAFILIKLREKRRENFKKKMVPVTGGGQVPATNGEDVDNSFAEMDKAVIQSNILSGKEGEAVSEENNVVSEEDEAAAVVNSVGLISQQEETQLLGQTQQETAKQKDADSVTAFEKLQADILQAKSAVGTGSAKPQSAQVVDGFMTQIDQAVDMDTAFKPTESKDIEVTQVLPKVEIEELTVEKNTDATEILGTLSTTAGNTSGQTPPISPANNARRGPVIWASRREKAEKTPKASQRGKTTVLGSTKADDLEIDFQLGEFGAESTQVLEVQKTEPSVDNEVSNALDNFDIQNKIDQNAQQAKSPFGQSSSSQLGRGNANRTKGIFGAKKRQIPNRKQQQIQQQENAIGQQAIAVGQSQVTNQAAQTQTASFVQDFKQASASQKATEQPESAQNSAMSNGYGGRTSGQNKPADENKAAGQPQPEDDILQGQIDMMIQSRKQNVPQGIKEEIEPQPQSHNVMKQVENPLANTLQQLVQEEQQVVVQQKHEIEKEVEQKQKQETTAETQNQPAVEKQQAAPPEQQENNKKQQGKKKRNRKKKKGKKK